MAEPWTFSRNEQTFTFDNGHVTFEAKTNIVSLPPSEPVTVESVSLTNHHDTFELGVHDLVVPPPVVEHLASHFPPPPPDLLLHI
jgi:hypothetical protein